MAKSKTYELLLKIGGKADASLKTACAEADKNLAAIGKSAKAMGKTVAKATAAAAAAVASVAAAAVKNAAEYETQLANVSTLLTGSETEVAARTAEIGDQIMEVSNRTGVVTADLTDGMYQVVSAFGDSADAAAILETAAKSAAAGNATTTDSINLLSAVTKGYGDTSAEAVQKAADLSFATVRLGQTSFPELAANMGKVIPLASALGLEQEQLFGAMSTLTGVTGSTAEVTTQLKATMQGFLSPSKAMEKALKKLGYASGQELLESKGLQGALEALKGTVKGDELAFAKMFSSVEAQTAVLALSGSQADNLSSKTAEMYEATGAANTAFERQTDTLAYDIQMIKNLGRNFLTELGRNVLPYVRELAEKALPVVSAALDKIGGYMTGTVIPAAQALAGWLAEHKGLMIALAAGIGAAIAAYKTAKAVLAIYNAVMAVHKVVTLASAAGTSLLAVAMNAVTWPILLVAAAIAAVVTVGVLLYKNWDKVKAAAIVVWEKIKGVWNVVAGWFKEKVITPLVNFFSPIVETISGIFKGCWIIIRAVWKVASEWFRSKVITPLVNFFSPIVDAIGGFFSRLWDSIVRIWSAAGSWFSEHVAGPIGTAFQAVGNFVKGVFNGIIGMVESVINKVIGAINFLIGGFNNVVGKAAGFLGIDWGGVSELPTVSLPRLAQGGIATAPTLAEIGEGGEPEAVLPLSKLSRMLGGVGTGGDIIYSPTITITGNADQSAVEQALDAGFEQFKRWYRRLQEERKRVSFSRG